MTPDLPRPVFETLRPLLEALPLDRAMPRLVEGSLSSGPYREIAERPAFSLAAYPGLVAGIWLYVDDLERAHEVCQADPSPVGSYWHAVVHRREGDFGNSRYWRRMAGRLPALEGFDGEVFFAEVARVHGVDVPELVVKQREEWKRLFEWCAREADLGD